MHKIYISCIFDYNLTSIFMSIKTLISCFFVFLLSYQYFVGPKSFQPMNKNLAHFVHHFFSMQGSLPIGLKILVTPLNSVREVHQEIALKMLGRWICSSCQNCQSIAPSQGCVLCQMKVETIDYFLLRREIIKKITHISNDTLL